MDVNDIIREAELVLQNTSDQELWDSAKGNDALFAVTNKALLTLPAPSEYFYGLQADQQLSALYPEIAEMAGVPQNPVFHPEGDVFEHTMLVIDRAAGLLQRAVRPLPFMYSALLHDIGKCVATEVQEDGRITAYGHEVQGDELVLRQMERLTGDNNITGYVLNQVQLHMRPNMLYGAKSKRKKTRQLFDLSVCPSDLILLSRADASGKLDAPYDENAEKWLRERLNDYNERMKKPMVTVNDLKAIGIDDADIDICLARARQLHLSGIEPGKVLKQIMKENMHMQN